MTQPEKCWLTQFPLRSQLQPILVQPVTCEARCKGNRNFRQEIETGFDEQRQEEEGICNADCKSSRADLLMNDEIQFENSRDNFEPPTQADQDAKLVTIVRDGRVKG